MLESKLHFHLRFARVLGCRREAPRGVIRLAHNLQELLVGQAHRHHAREIYEQEHQGTKEAAVAKRKETHDEKHDTKRLGLSEFVKDVGRRVPTAGLAPPSAHSKRKHKEPQRKEIHAHYPVQRRVSKQKRAESKAHREQRRGGLERKLPVLDLLEGRLRGERRGRRGHRGSVADERILPCTSASARSFRCLAYVGRI